MDALNTRHIDAGDGTPESAWRTWLDGQSIPSVAAGTLVGPAQRAVVVAPHPDDEVLAVGGLLTDLSAQGRRVALVAVTDGEASHPGSRIWPPAQLAKQRIHETTEALQALGVSALVTRLGLPDGGLAHRVDRLADMLRRLLQPDDVVFTTWGLDGHPDHEATCQAARAAAASVGARVFEVPVWGWHWAPVGDARMPWAKACKVLLTPDAVDRKSTALQAFATQLQPDPSMAGSSVLRPSTVQRALRPFEVVFA